MRKEIVQSLKGVAVGVLCPVFAIYASTRPVLGVQQLTQGYCNDPHGVGWQVRQEEGGGWREVRYCTVLCCNGSSVLCYAVTAPLCCAVLYCALLSHRAICCKWLSSSASATSWSTATTGSGTTSTSCGERPLERERDTDSHRERESVGYADCCCGGLLVVL